jgi:hypothetical protein
MAHAGQALQAGLQQMEGGLALLYPALAWSVCAPGHHGYPRAPDLILGKALNGRLGHQITGTTARPFLHLLNPTRRPRQVVVLVISQSYLVKVIIVSPKHVVGASSHAISDVTRVS